MRVAFVWQGISDPTVLATWKDGLWQAVQHLKTVHEVDYREPFEDLSGYDVILYWEAPCTVNGQHAANYRNVQRAPGKKALLFAGGPLKKEWVDGFDVVVVESLLNRDECADQGIPHDVAFGVNCDLWAPTGQPKRFLGAHHGACAGWKRQHLAAEALGKDLILVGPYQECDPYPFDRARELGATVVAERVEPERCRDLVDQARVLVQTCDYWGGGQRATLEAMALGLPVVAMRDSPKNREFVEGSGCGEVVLPEPGAIREACEALAASWTAEDARVSREYVRHLWSGQRYGKDLQRIIENL